MYYYIRKPTYHDKEYTFKELLLDFENELLYPKTRTNISNTVTNLISDEQLNKMPFAPWCADIIFSLITFYEKYRHLNVFKLEKYNYAKQVDFLKIARHKINTGEITVGVEQDKEVVINTYAKTKLEELGYEFQTNYHTFWIPKSSGGYRQIDAPSSELKECLSELQHLFERFMNGNFYHTSAYAYIPRRSTIDCVKKHQLNASRWTLKLDFSNFFGSTDIEFVEKQLLKLYPFAKLKNNEVFRDIFHNCLELCFLDGVLPQGSPISPLLTNMMMIPIDFEITQACLKRANEITDFQCSDNDIRKHRLIYTRYADDIYISSRKGFKYSKVIDFINTVLEKYEAPFKLNARKTTYGSSAGRNWHLGLMLNADNNITIGYKKKERMRAILFNFAKAYQNEDMSEWSLHDLQQLLGEFNYCQNIEPDYWAKKLQKIKEKTGIDVIKSIRLCLKNPDLF